MMVRKSRGQVSSHRQLWPVRKWSSAGFHYDQAVRLLSPSVARAIKFDWLQVHVTDTLCIQLMRTLETPQWQVTAYYFFLLADWARFVLLRAPGDILFMIRIDIRTNL